MKITLTNKFHNTSCNLNVFLIKGDHEIQISEGQYKKIKKELCGIRGCSCSDFNNYYVYDEEDWGERHRYTIRLNNQVNQVNQAY